MRMWFACFSWVLEAVRDSGEWVSRWFVEHVRGFRVHFLETVEFIGFTRRALRVWGV